MDVILENGDGLDVCRVAWFDRMRARAMAPGLDRQLAQGVSPDSSVLLAVRARKLVQPSESLRLAGALERIAAADRPDAAPLRIPVNRHAVRRAGRELRLLADRLRTGGVDVQTIARLRNLVSDGTGPLYAASSSQDLRAELSSCARQAMS
jgi:hypothetical protein